MKRCAITWSLAAAIGACACAITLAAGCGDASAPNPFFPADASADASASGEDAGSGGGGGLPGDAGSDADSTLGGPCLDDGQCNDGIACTFDTCDQALGRCRNIPDDSQCQDGVYCNGMEVCELQHGCVPGAPVSCNDNDECTVDACVEATQSCTHTPRDADGDGDPDDHCGGHDCDDNDPTVSSLLPEVCSNGKDDNCNGVVDEMPCVAVTHSTCLDALEISASGTYAMNTNGAPFQYPTSCGLGGVVGSHEVVLAVLLPAGPPVDVEVTARTASAQVAVAMAGQCSDPSTELACGGSFASSQGGNVARVRARALGSTTQATAYPIYVESSTGTAVAVDVQILPPVPAPTNVSCGTATPITPGVAVAADILDATQNVGSACATKLGSLVYSFTLAAPSNVDVYASSNDGTGAPVISLRDPGCSLPVDEITCQAAPTVHVVRQALAAGTYYVAVSASAPTSVEVTVDLSPPTTPAPDQSCTGAPVIVPNKTIPVSLSTHEDDAYLGCNPGAVDAAYELDLAAASDVLIVERTGQGDTGAVGLATPACSATTALLCQTGNVSPVRASKRSVPAGQYRVVVESLLAQDAELTAFVRDAVPPTLVPFAAGCAEAFPIPSTGGFFQGNTANSTASFPAGCDYGGVPGNGAPDELLVLTLAAPQRVVFDMEGSGYYTLLDIRQGPTCPGTEIPLACTIGVGAPRSYLDLQLDAGTYYIQIDGYDLSAGPWFLDVRVVDPLIRLAGAASLAALVPERTAAAERLPPDDLARLARDEIVRVPVDFDTPQGDYFGGISYMVIPAPIGEVIPVLDDPSTYTSILPFTLEARLLGRPGGDKQVLLRQGVRLNSAAYVILVRRESPSLFRFWLDFSQPHQIEDFWGFFRVGPWEGGATLLTYAAVVRLEPGLVKLLFSSTIRSKSMDTPGLVRAYVMARHKP